MTELLAIHDVQVNIGDVCVVRQASMSVSDGQGVALLGANGAGKTTLVAGLSGTRAVSGGRISFDGLDISTWSPERRVRAGLVLVPQGRMLFADMTIHENLRVGASVKRDRPVGREDWERIHAMFPPLKDLADRKCGSLSGGEQQMVAVGRALMARPRLLVLDEPSLGLSPLMVDRLYATLRDIRNLGVAVLVVEQLVGHALRLTDQVHVLRDGILTHAGPSSVLVNSERFIADYFGE